MKRSILLILSFAFALISLIGCATSAVLVEEPAGEPTAQPATPTPEIVVQTGTYTKTLTHDGLERSYLLHVPEAANNGEPLPLLLNLHGFTGTSESQLDYADFRGIADREGIILVYPQGTLLDGRDTHWNVGGWTRASTIDDTGFLSELIDVVSSDFNIDAQKVYSIGHSNGGYMSFLLACQIGEKITARNQRDAGQAKRLY